MLNIKNITRKLLASFVLSLIPFCMGFAQITFEDHVICDSLNASWIVPSDIDADGDIDLVASQYFSGRQGDPWGDAVIWLENDGFQNFIYHTLTDNFPRARTVHVTDIDGDSDLDIFAGAETMYAIRFWVNNGENPPEFAERYFVDDYRHIHAIRSADFDNDGDIDIVASGSDISDLVWFENEGEGDFSEILIDDYHHPVICIEIADFNHDGIPDILSSANAVGDRGVRVYINDCEEEPEFTRYIVGYASSHASFVQAIDITRDNFLDILCGQQNFMDWFENLGEESPTYTRHYIFRNLFNMLGRNGASGCDMDCDGDIDIVSMYRSSGNAPLHLLFLINDGFENFSTDTLSYTYNFRSVFPFDLDQDSDNDIILDGEIEWLENTQNPVPDASVHGTVTIEESGDNLSNAEVIFGKWEVLTDENGYYEIDSVYSIPYTVLIRADGFERYIEPDIDVDPGENTLNFELSPAETQPTRFSLLSPDSNSLFNNEYIELTWHVSNDTDFGDSLVYDVFVQSIRNDTFITPVVSGLTDTFYIFQATGDSVWNWTIHARDTNTEGRWAQSIWRFATRNIVQVEKIDQELPNEYSIVSLHPNPFNSVISAVVGIPERSHLSAVVYDLLGREVEVLFTGIVQPGYRKISWSARDSAGIYFIKISSHSGWAETRKLLYLK
ncbi:MAG: FG-GAP-like repeat-containing protein [Candidatus Electryonea clarkiae]|nr:FG-GAP-like repeat-containing protein [Candidatus Electryonea clarkiae]MDP8288821.1 FG-GAP-like repeat-containing protein [Candidatus Electryonea clarkiae]